MPVATPHLAEPPRYTARQIAETVALSPDQVHGFWRALGFAAVDDDAVEFTESDLRAIGTAMKLLNTGTTDVRRMLRLTRLLGRATAGLASAHVHSIVERLSENGVADADITSTTRELAQRFSPDLEWLVGFTWRRHLVAAVNDLRAAPPTDTHQTMVGVGFADIVGFTELSMQLSDANLSRLVERFEDGVADRIAEHDGQLVKTIGDEVLFTTDNPASLVQIASGLLREFTSDPYVGALRIGLSYGPAIRRLGDVFGATVNLASRMTDIAEPNTVVASPEVAAALHENPQFKFEPLAERSIAGIGRVTPLVVISTPDGALT